MTPGTEGEIYAWRMMTWTNNMIMMQKKRNCQLMGDSRSGMYEMQMDPCGLYGNQVNDDGWTGDGFFSRKEEYKHTETGREGDMAKRKHGVDVWKK